MTDEVQIYAEGIFYCSPCGTAKDWTVSKNATFSDDKPMTCLCENDPARQHWLLEA